MEYKFYGNDMPSVKPKDKRYAAVEDQRKLYDILSGLWCEYTCSPSMRKDWGERNKTCGQCAVTAFLAQDIFGGTVYGIPLGDGAIHCYNVVDGVRFDLTSEQFGEKILRYDDKYEQDRNIHFSKEEKRFRYEYLKRSLDNFLGLK